MGERTIPPFSLRLTFEERAKLERDAAGMALGAYIRSRLLDPETVAPRKRGKFPVKDHQALAQLLGLLGQSRLANNVKAKPSATAMVARVMRVHFRQSPVIAVWIWDDPSRVVAVRLPPFLHHHMIR